MQQTNGVVFYGDIGGPMDLGSGYRWNVPVVTYGFDQSFLDYFGPNGVTAVEEAIQILNDLPPASDIVPTNYPFDTRGINDHAQAMKIYDLKSETLIPLLEEMGLAPPTRNIFVLRRWNSIFLTYPYSSDWISWAIPNYIVERNFDPETFVPSQTINGVVFGGIVDSFPSGNDAIEFPADPLASPFSAVADGYGGSVSANPATGFYLPGLQLGGFYTGLTSDDVGGFHYLLGTNNVSYENVLPDVHVVGLHHRAAGYGAWRPGVEKITFVRQPFNSRIKKFRPLTYHFIDVSFENNHLIRRQANRTVPHPDFLFCAADMGKDQQWIPLLTRSGTTNWQNNAALNGNPDGEGPGIIQGPIKITFQKQGAVFTTSDGVVPTSIDLQGWGTFDGSTNLPVLYPVAPPINTPLTVRLRYYGGTSNVYDIPMTNYAWHLPVPVGGHVSFQVSSNQIDWSPVATATNAGAVIEWDYYGHITPPKFFRVVPQ